MPTLAEFPTGTGRHARTGAGYRMGMARRAQMYAVLPTGTTRPAWIVVVFPTAMDSHVLTFVGSRGEMELPALMHVEL